MWHESFKPNWSYANILPSKEQKKRLFNTFFFQGCLAICIKTSLSLLDTSDKDFFKNLF